MVEYRKKLESINDGVMSELEEISSELDLKNPHSADVEELEEFFEDVEVVSTFPPPKEPE